LAAKGAAPLGLEIYLEWVFYKGAAPLGLFLPSLRCDADLFKVSVKKSEPSIDQKNPSYAQASARQGRTMSEVQTKKAPNPISAISIIRVL
jgi:hypothetical protein